MTPDEMARVVADRIEACLDEHARLRHPDAREPWWEGRVRFQRAYAQRVRNGHVDPRRVAELHAAMAAHDAAARRAGSAA